MDTQNSARKNKRMIAAEELYETFLVREIEKNLMDMDQPINHNLEFRANLS